MPLTVCTTVSKPRRDAHGPTWLNAHRETNTMPGRTFASASGEKPRVAIGPGRSPPEATSAPRTRRSEDGREGGGGRSRWWAHHSEKKQRPRGWTQQERG